MRRTPRTRRFASRHLSAGPAGLRYLVAAALLLIALAIAPTLGLHPTPASAAFAPPRTGEAAHASAGKGFVRLGGDRISLDSTSPAIVAGEPFGFSAALRTSAPAQSARLRLKLWRPTGRLIFQRTSTFANLAKGAASQAFFGRETSDLSLRPGSYPVELEASITRNGRTQTATIASTLYVVAQVRSVTTALVVHVNGQPLADPNGVFVTNPAEYTRARDDVNEVTSWILSDQTARCTLAISPLLLEEWQRIASGYKLVAPEGTVEVADANEVPLAYSATLSQLKTALATGRLELTAQGYSDPDLSDLQDAELIQDVSQQYEHGVSALFASLEATASTGTVPARGWVPPAAVPLLDKAGIGYAVASEACARNRSKAASPSAYYSGAGGIVVLVADGSLTQALVSGDASASTSITFQRLLDPAAQGPLVMAAELGVGGASAKTLLRSFDDLRALPWIETRLAREVAQSSKQRTVRLRSGKGSEGDPATYWDEVRDGRLWSDSLVAAIGENSPEAVTAHRDSMIAECSAWAGADDAWALEHRGRTFAVTAKRLSTDVLDKVRIDMQPVTLAGTFGKVPVTITNASGQPLTVRLALTSEDGVHITGQAERTLQLGPKDTFVEVPVRLTNVLSGGIHVALYAGAAKLDSASVTVKASYLDRIALIFGVILALVGLLIYIIRRVSRAEQGWATAPHAEQDVSEEAEAYTGQTSFEELWRDK